MAKMTSETERQIDLLAANVVALLQLMVTKGIATEEEVEAEVNRATERIQQEKQKNMDEFMNTEEGRAFAFLQTILGSGAQ